MNKSWIIGGVVILAPIMWFLMGGPHGVVAVVAVGFLFLAVQGLPERRGKPWYGLQITASGGLGAFLVIWFVFEIFDPYLGSVLDRMLFVETRAFEIDLKINIDGEDVRLNRRIRCAHRRTLSTRSFLTSSNHYPGVDSFGQNLKSGGAVIVVTPFFCHEPIWTNPKFTSSKNFIELDFVPLIGWMDDAKQPTKTELYVSYKYYENPKARIKINSFRARPTSAWWFLDGHDDFAYFTRLPSLHRKPTDKNFSAYLIQGVELERFVVKEFADNLNGNKRFELVPKSPNIAPLREKFSRIGYNSIPLGNRFRPMRRTGLNDGYPSKYVKNPFAEAIPLRMIGNVHILSRFERGILAFYPTYKLETNKKICPKIKIGNETLPCPKNFFFDSNFIFDRKKSVLYRVAKITRSWPYRNNDEIR